MIQINKAICLQGEDSFLYYIIFLKPRKHVISKISSVILHLALEWGWGRLEHCCLNWCSDFRISGFNWTWYSVPALHVSNNLLSSVPQDVTYSFGTLFFSIPRLSPLVPTCPLSAWDQTVIIKHYVIFLGLTVHLYLNMSLISFWVQYFDALLVLVILVTEL